MSHTPMRVTKVKVPVVEDGSLYRATSNEGEVLESGDLAPLLRLIADSLACPPFDLTWTVKKWAQAHRDHRH